MYISQSNGCGSRTVKRWLVIQVDQFEETSSRTLSDDQQLKLDCVRLLLTNKHLKQPRMSF